MRYRRRNNAHNIIDTACAVSISLLLINIISAALFKIDIDHALINIIATIIPSISILFNSRFIVKKGSRLLIGILLILCQIITVSINLPFTDTKNLLFEIITIVCFSLNIIAYCSLSGKTIGDMKKTYTVLYFFAFIFCLYNIVLNRDSILNLSFLNDSQNVSFSSFFVNRNNFAMYLFLSLVLIDTICANRIKKTNGKDVIIAIILINLALTFSRTAILSTVVYYAIKLLLNGKWKGMKKTAIILLCVVSFVALLYSPVANKFFIRFGDGDSGRHLIWSSAIESFSERPLFGRGEGLASVYIKDNSGNAYFHNVIIKNLATNGLFFVALLLLLIVNHIKIMKPLEERNYDFVAITISILLYGFFETYDFFGFGLFNMGFTMAFFVLPLMLGEPKNEC